MRGFRRIDILGCPFDSISFAETVGCIENATLDDSCLQVVPGSIDHVIKARKAPQFSSLLARADLVVADGVPIVWASKILKDPIKGRVSGTDLVWECARISSELLFPVALVGGKYELTQRAALKMMERHIKASLVPLETPFPLGPEDSRMLVNRIRALGAKIVLAAFGAPKQERWIQENLRETGAHVGIGIGSAFDIISGDKPRAPGFLRDHGFEWLWRMIHEPRRLWKRYLIEDVPFLYLIVREGVLRSFKRKK